MESHPSPFQSAFQARQNGFWSRGLVMLLVAAELRMARVGKWGRDDNNLMATSSTTNPSIKRYSIILRVVLSKHLLCVSTS